MDHNSEELPVLIYAQKMIWAFKYGSALLILILILILILHIRDNRKNERELRALRRQVNVLKAEVYDFKKEDLEDDTTEKS